MSGSEDMSDPGTWNELQLTSAHPHLTYIYINIYIYMVVQKKRSYNNFTCNCFKPQEILINLHIHNEPKINYQSKLLLKLSTRSSYTQTKSLAPLNGVKISQSTNFVDCFINYLRVLTQVLKMLPDNLNTNFEW